jgi:peroxiredoxin
MYPLKLGDAAPEISLRQIEGNDVWRLSDQRGKMVVLYFARGEYCPTTRGEFANYNSYSRLFPKMNCEVAFLVNGGEKEHQQFIKDTRFRLPLLLDPDGSVGETYGVYDVNSHDLKREDYPNYKAPAVYLINADGTIGCFWLAGGPRGLPTPECVLGILGYAQNNDWKY